MENRYDKKPEEAKADKKQDIGYKKTISAISCLGIMIIVIFAVPNIVKYYIAPDSSKEIIQDIVQYSSVEELSTAIGFELKEIKEIPFEPEEIVYTSYWNKVAEIQYIGKERDLTFRMAKGNQNIGGDYNKYSSTIEISGNNYRIDIGGRGEEYNLATWTYKEYSYAINTLEGISEKQMLEIIEGIHEV